MADAVAAMSAGLTSPFEVTGAAHAAPGAALLFTAGPARALRVAELEKHHLDGVQLLADSGGDDERTIGVIDQTGTVRERLADLVEDRILRTVD